MRDRDSKLTGGRLLCLRVRLFGKPSVLINIHTPTEVPADQPGKSLITYQTEFYDRLKKKLQYFRRKGRQIVLGGDFNSAHCADILPPPSGGSDARTRAQDALDPRLKPFKLSYVWREAYPVSSTFTYSQAGKRSGARLDRFYVSAELTQRVTALHPLLGYPGDHLTVGLQLGAPPADSESEPQKPSMCWDPYALQKFLSQCFKTLQHEHWSHSELRAAREALQACLEHPEVSNNWKNLHGAHKYYQQRCKELASWRHPAAEIA